MFGILSAIVGTTIYSASIPTIPAIGNVILPFAFKAAATTTVKSAVSPAARTVFRFAAKETLRIAVNKAFEDEKN